MRKRTILVLLTVALLVGPPALAENSASGQTTSAAASSGSFSAGLKEDDGVSNYTIRYSYPSSVTVGSNLIVRATLEVNTLTGLKLYVRHYRFDASVIANGTPASSATNASDAFARPLYAGSHWGPRELVIPINSSALGIKPGQTVQVNITLSFLGDVYHDNPVSAFATEGGRSTLGTVSIISPAGQSGLSLGEAAAAAAVVILVAIAVYAATRRRATKI